MRGREGREGAPGRFRRRRGKLKESCPYLFEEKPKQTGSTGKPPAGASKAMDEKLDKIFGV